MPIPPDHVGEPAYSQQAPAEQGSRLSGLVPGAIRSASMPLPRPGHVAEREELDAAHIKGTAEAYILFIERHPASRYRAEAEARLRKLGITPPVQSPSP